MISEDGSLLTCPKQIVEHLKKYIVSIGTTLADKIPSSYSSYTLPSNSAYQNSFMFYPTNVQEVTEVVQNLNDKKSAGFDNIPTTVVRCSISSIAVVLSELIN